jgi:hypothetical protein
MNKSHGKHHILTVADFVFLTIVQQERGGDKGPLVERISLG